MKTQIQTRIGLAVGLTLALALLAGLAPRAEAVAYTWTGASASWTNAANWTPSGPPTSSGDMGTVTSGTAYANAVLGIEGNRPTIAVGTGGTVRLDVDLTGTSTGHVFVLNGGVLQKQTMGANTIRTMNDTIRLEGSGYARGAGDNSDLDLSGLIEDGAVAGKLYLRSDNNNAGKGIKLSRANNTYSGGTEIEAATGRIYVSGVGGLGLGDVLVTGGAILHLATNNTTAAGKVITVNSNGTLRIGTPGTFNSYGLSIRLLDGSYFQSGGSAAFNYLNCYDSISLEGSVYVKKALESGTMTLYSAISNGASAGKIVIQAPGSNGRYVYLANPGNTFSGGIDIQAAGYLGFISNNVAGSGPITLLATNSYLTLDQNPNADWTVTNTLAGKGTITVEAGAGANRLTSGGTVNPGIGGATVTTNTTGILTIAGAMGFAVGSQLTIDIASTNGVAGVDFDRLVVNYALTNLNNATLYVNVATNLARNALVGQEFIVVTNSTVLASTFGTVTGSGDGSGKIWTCTVVTNNPSRTVKLTELYLRNPSAPIVNNANGATNVQGDNAWLNGTLVSTGVAPASVSVYWGTNDGVFVKSAWGNTNDFGLCTNGQALTTNVVLSPGTTYYYRFYATNTAGYDEWADLSTFSTPDTVPPEVTTNTGATAVEKTTATLNGLLTAGGTAEATIYWGQDTNAWANTNTFAEDVVQDIPFSANITGLSPGTTYYYMCYATNVNGDAYSEIASFPTKPAVQYTWKVNNGTWDTAANWDPAGGPPGIADTGILTGLTCIASANLAGGPTIEVRTNASLYCGSAVGGSTTFTNHTIVLNGGRWVLNSGFKGIITSSDTVALESDSEMRAGINSDDQQWILSGLIRDGFGGGKGKLTLNTTGLDVGNAGRGLLDITGTNNTYSGGTVLFSDTLVDRGPVRVFATGGLGLSNVLVSAYGYLNIGATNTTADGRTITVENNGLVVLGIGGGGVTFNSRGHQFLLQDGALLRSGLSISPANVVNSHDTFSLEGTAQVQNGTVGSFHIHGPVTDGGGAGKMLVLAPTGAASLLYLRNPGNTFSGGLDIQAAGYVSIATNDAYGTGPITLLATNSYLLLDQATNTDWTVTNNIAGNGTITVEAGDGVKKLTCTGTVDPGTNGVAVTTNSTGVLRVDGDLAFGVGSRLRIHIAGTNGVAGVDFDRLQVDHDLTGLGNAVLEVNVNTNLATDALDGQELVVVSNATSLAGAFASVQWGGRWIGQVTYNEPAGTVKLVNLGVERGTVFKFR